MEACNTRKLMKNRLPQKKRRNLNLRSYYTYNKGFDTGDYLVKYTGDYCCTIP